MACFIVGCRLGTPGGDYTQLAERLEQLGRTWECPGTAWIVASDLDATQLRDELRACIGQGDQLFVAELSGAVAWGGTSRGFADGLRAVLG